MGRFRGCYQHPYAQAWLAHGLRQVWRASHLLKAAARLPMLRDDAPAVDWHAARIHLPHIVNMAVLTTLR